MNIFNKLKNGFDNYINNRKKSFSKKESLGMVSWYDTHVSRGFLFDYIKL
ncbi:MAG: hypothetical protein K6B41_01170 [Butyrivibrio sp.]|nr:hypothetical protein [Butyrivibrio sp.]